MYYIPELFCRQNRGALSRCWLAATLNENQFKKICSGRQLSSIDIERSCEEIQNVITCDTRARLRFSLYLSSQLMYGITKILEYKTRALNVEIKNIQYDMMSLNKKKKELTKKPRNELTIADIDIPDPPPLKKNFSSNTKQIDRHLIIDDICYDAGLLYVDFAENIYDNFEFDKINADELEHLRDFTNVDMSTSEKLVVDRDLTDLQDNNIIKTPTKRKTQHTDPGTSSKRYRSLLETVENQDNVAMVEVPPPLAGHSRIEESRLLLDDVLPLPEASEDQVISSIQNASAHDRDATEPTQRNLSGMMLESLHESEIPPRARRRKNLKVIDVEINIPAEQMRSRMNNTRNMTYPSSFSRINIHRTRLDSQLLFNRPATFWRPKSYCAWAKTLYFMFLNHIEGPFHVNYNESFYDFTLSTSVSETMRFHDTNEKTAEVSDDLNKRHLSVSREQESTDHQITEIPVLPEVSHVQIAYEPIDIGSIGVVEHVQDEAITNVGDAISTIPAVDTIPIINSERTSDSSDFLPPPFEKEEAPLGQKISSGEKTIDTSSIPRSSRSQSDPPGYADHWDKEMLYEELRRRWSESPEPMRFNHLFPPEITYKADGACGLLDLLHMANNHLIQLKQAEAFSTIWVLCI